jgi:D-alanyl-D-alanine carboxypeptidase
MISTSARPAGPRRIASRWTLAAVLVLSIGMVAGVTGTAAAAPPELPSCRIADVLTQHRRLSDWNRSLLDLTYRLRSTYRPHDLRSTRTAGLTGGGYVRKHVVRNLRAMARAARLANARFSVQSAYRSYRTQRTTFNYWVRVHGMERALQESARPGHSEHQLGTTLDFRSYGRVRAPWDYADWGRTRAGKWLAANAWRYGFVMSYPKGKDAVTCYQYEPWHFRYVGKARARAIRESGLTLREYLWYEQNGGLPVTDPAPPTPTPTPTPTPVPTPEPVG